jgi:hypothetical protein
VVERGPEKAGVGGSIPSLATTISATYGQPGPRFHFNSFQIGAKEFAPDAGGGKFSGSIFSMNSDARTA